MYSVSAQTTYYYPRNLVSPHFRNIGDIYANACLSNYVTEFNFGYAISDHLAAYIGYSRAVSKFDDDIFVSNSSYNTYRYSDAMTYAVGRYLNQSKSSSIRLGLFSEYMVANDRTIAEQYFIGTSGNLNLRYRVLAFRANVLFRDDAPREKSRFGYSVRVGHLDFTRTSTSSKQLFESEISRIKTAQSYWILEHGVKMIFVGKRLNIYGQVNFNHSFFKRNISGPMPRNSVNWAIGISITPNVFNIYDVSDNLQKPDLRPEPPQR
ncbi:MAG: hypothetical protein IT245_02340 [Bacteroidia bacterium]|nr:hypothetical protein [Bacteroidia bacterium]